MASRLDSQSQPTTGMVPDRIRVLVVGDDTNCKLLGSATKYPRLEIMAKARDTAKCLRPAISSCTDVVLIDEPVAGQSGVELIERIRMTRPAVRLIVRSAMEDEEHLFAALRAGVDCYLLSDSSEADIAAAVEAVYRGERLVDPRLLTIVLRGFEILAKRGARFDIGLTEEDLQVLRAMRQGATNEEIAKALCWSKMTIKRRAHDIFRKLRVSGRSEAVAEAIRLGLL